VIGNQAGGKPARLLLVEPLRLVDQREFLGLLLGNAADLLASMSICRSDELLEPRRRSTRPCRRCPGKQARKARDQDGVAEIRPATP
jgi:hypothetical protein